MIHKTGGLWTQNSGFFGLSWELKFVVLTNAGFVYFTFSEMGKNENMVPKHFEPLNEFVIVK